jgi:DUF1365 family protein
MDATTMSAPLPAPSNRALIGFGDVIHRRLRPVEHKFRYANYFLLLPMRSWRNQARFALPRNRFGLLSFYDRDHGDGGHDALQWLDDLLQQEGIADASGEVWLHTYPRVLGYAFKPVSFWYAHRKDGSLAAVLAEVNNTFGERHCYLLAGSQLRWGEEICASKAMYVSPFCKVEGEYRFRFLRADVPVEGGRTLVRIDLNDAQGALLQTSVSGELRPLNWRSTLRAFFGVPLMTLSVIARIHWQALRLFFKRVPFVSKPAAPDTRPTS